MAGPAEQRVIPSGSLAPLTRGMSSDSVDRSSRTVDDTPRKVNLSPSTVNGLSSDGDGPSSEVPGPESRLASSPQDEEGLPAQEGSSSLREVERSPQITVNIRGENGTILGDIEIAPAPRNKAAVTKQHPRAAVNNHEPKLTVNQSPQTAREQDSAATTVQDPATVTKQTPHVASSQEPPTASRLQSSSGQTTPLPPPPQRLDLVAAVTHGAQPRSEARRGGERHQRPNLVTAATQGAQSQSVVEAGRSGEWRPPEPRAELLTSETLRRRLQALDEEFRRGFVVPAVVPPLFLGSAVTTPASSRAATPASSRATTPRHGGQTGPVGGRQSVSARGGRKVHFADQQRQPGDLLPRPGTGTEMERQASGSGAGGSVETRTEPGLGTGLGQEPRLGSGPGLRPAAQAGTEVPTKPPRRLRLPPASVSRAVQTSPASPHFTCLPSLAGLRGGRVSRLRRGALRSCLCQLVVLTCWLLAAAALLLLAEAPAERRERRQLSRRRADLVVELATELRQVVPQQAVWRHKISQYMRRLERTVLTASERGLRLDDGGGLQGAGWSYGAALYAITASAVTLGPGPLAPQSPLGSVVLTVTVAVALPLSVSLAASLVSLLRRRLLGWLDSTRCCRRRPPGAQVHPQPPVVYTVPPRNGRASMANGVPHRGQGHAETANQNGRAAETGRNGRPRPNSRAAPLQNGPLTSHAVRSETEDGLLTPNAVNRETENGPMTSHSTHETADGRLTPDAAYDEDAVGFGATARKRPPEPSGQHGTTATYRPWLDSVPALGSALALYVLCGALVLGVSRSLDAGSAVLAALLAVTGGQLPALAGPAAAAGLVYAMLGMVLTVVLCVGVFRGIRSAASSR